MTDKEFKRLSRSQLIEIIYQLQIKQEELTAENEKLSKELEDRRIRVEKAGDIASASLEIHNVMQAAQDAADHYLEEMKCRIDAEQKRILDETISRAEALLVRARKDAQKITARAMAENPVYVQNMDENI